MLSHLLRHACIGLLRHACIGLLLMMNSFNVSANESESVWTSASPPAPMLELYTSQGCYSCPAAEAWMNRLKDHPNLWQGLIPINLHVDYWDYLGWKDPYARPTFSQRQRRYQQVGASKNVATPGFVYGGWGWNGWFAGRDLPDLSPSYASAALKVKFVGDTLEITWPESLPENTEVYAHAARLGFGLIDQISAGENKGETLHHDFVVTAYVTGRMEAGY
ncbi:MAG: DUF1223 domain-containing protein, partial [Salinisphaeraceae bacterium]|nr:DUF1223 domain-containing protein [Salinisphaeraceae bacterium]